VSETREHTFNRTTCACDQCTRCCKRQPGALAAGDLDRIVSFVAQRQAVTLEVAFERVKAQLWASPGALVMDTETGQLRRIGSITPQMRRGRCVFLDQNDRCSIHPVAPFGCSHFDTHMPHSTAHPRSVWLALSTEDPAYKHLRKELPYARSYKPQRY
jgi:Fe-S-cluster containining protein